MDCYRYYKDIGVICLYAERQLLSGVPWSLLRSAKRCFPMLFRLQPTIDGNAGAIDVHWPKASTDLMHAQILQLLTVS